MKRLKIPIIINADSKINENKNIMREASSKLYNFSICG